ncbi:UNVERIFIED_CONTAM: aminobenzoyl-glutamate utilization protein A [Brevibacillus sp. OAP136]
MKQQVADAVKSMIPELVAWRRDFHQFAESGWVEFRTASKVAALLKEWGYDIRIGHEVVKAEARMGVPHAAFLAEQEKRAIEQGAEAEWLPYLSGGFTGVVGILDTGKPGPTIGFRFDMDALDIQESMEGDHLPKAGGYASINAGMMHACGHDAHTAIGLGLAKLLMEQKDQLSGRIKIVFQPAEEGVRGAKAMVEAGVLDDVELFFSGHIGCDIPLGEVVCGANGYLATTKLDVTFKGYAAHAGGSPEEGKNALLAAASAVLNLHSIPRHSKGASRINVGVLHGGSGRNVIPGSAFLKVETRGATSEINEYMLERAVQIIKGAAIMHEAQEQIEIVGMANSCDSSEALIPYIRAQAEQVADVHAVHDIVEAGGSEDATYMLQRVQDNGGLASYLMFGTTLAAGHHNEKFDIDEKVMAIAIQTYALCALNAGDLAKR